MMNRSGASARTCHLVVPTLPLHLYAITCKFKDAEVHELGKSLLVRVPSDNLIVVYSRSEVVESLFGRSLGDDPSDVYCRLGEAVAPYTIQVVKSLCEGVGADDVTRFTACYLEGNGYELSEISKGLREGVRQNTATLQRFLERMIAKKRWNLVLCLGRVRRCYQRFLEGYYAPEGDGYRLAEDDFRRVINTSFHAD